MTEVNLDTTDLPLGTVFPDAPYNQVLLKAIHAARNGETLSQDRLAELERHRQALWQRSNELKDQDLKAYGRLTAERYGFNVEGDRLCYPWMTADYRRVGYQSDFFTFDREKRALVPFELDHTKPRVIVFATGRAFAEKNARLGSLRPDHAVQKARDVMSAQVHLVRSRLVQADDDSVQVAAVAYDMVTNEEETPALRIQALLDSGMLHQVSIRAAERIFGPILGEFETFPTGRIVRRDGCILGTRKSDDEIIEGLSHLALVGGSVGCIITLQAARWLDALLLELGVKESVRAEAQRSFMVVNLGPTTPLRAGPTNLLSVMNLRDEFVFAGNHTAPYERRLSQGERCLMPEDPTNDHDRSNEWTIALDVDGSITPDDTGFRFDPLGTHFGHSLKYYADGLRKLGVNHILRRALARDGAYRLGEMVAEATRSGELDLPAVSDGKS